jgi:hypothetical protein
MLTLNFFLSEKLHIFRYFPSNFKVGIGSNFFCIFFFLHWLLYHFLIVQIQLFFKWTQWISIFLIHPKNVFSLLEYMWHRVLKVFEIRHLLWLFFECFLDYLRKAIYLFQDFIYDFHNGFVVISWFLISKHDPPNCRRNHSIGDPNCWFPQQPFSMPYWRRFLQSKGISFPCKVGSFSACAHLWSLSVPMWDYDPKRGWAGFE